MALKTPPALVRVVSFAALALVLASCGGGSTAVPIAQTATTPSPPPAHTQPAAAPGSTATVPTPAAPASRPAPRPAAQPRGGRSRSPGGAASPRNSAAAGEGGSLADAPPATGEAAAPAPEEPAETLLDERADLILTRRITNTHYFQQGTVTGTYDGTMATEARITSKGVLVRFTATLPGGTISGRAVAVAILDSATWPGLRGRAIITGGTGRFAGIRGRGLKVTGRSKPDASHTRVRLAGAVSY